MFETMTTEEMIDAWRDGAEPGRIDDLAQEIIASLAADWGMAEQERIDAEESARSRIFAACPDELRDELRNLIHFGDSLCNAAARPSGATHRAVMRTDLEVVRQMNRGGQGTIFEAIDRALGRSAVVKVSNFTGTAALEAEAITLAGFDHPAIVPIYALGRDQDGRFCFAMRKLEETTLRDLVLETHKRRSAGRLTRRRLRSTEFADLFRIFQTVCRAIAHAHERGVIHRDLHPENIHIHQGEPVVLDFGLAEPHAGILADSAVSPIRFASVGRPEYRAPEQERGGRGEPRPQSDVYSLGAILLHLVTNHDKPDRTLASSARLPRPLRKIIQKAMAVEPGGRYGTVRDLSADLGRFLADEPVSVDREPLAERFRRWAERHRTGVVAAMVASTLAVGAAWMLSRAHQREYQRSLLQQIAEANAREQARNAEWLTRFLSQVFRSTDPLPIEGRAPADGVDRPSARESLRIIETSTRAYLEDGERTAGISPSLRATVLDMIGNSYRAVAEPSKARPFLEKALGLRRQNLPSDDPMVAESLYHLAMLNQIAGRFDEAESGYREALRILSSRTDNKPRDIDRVQFQLAWLLGEMKQLPESSKLFHQVWKDRERLAGPDDPETQNAHVAWLIVTLQPENRTPLLVKLSTLELKDPFVQGFHLFIAADLARKNADKTRLAADVERARVKLDNVREYIEKYLPPRHFLLGMMLGDMASFEDNHGNTDRAVELIGRAFAIARQVAPSHPLFIDALDKYGRRMVELNRTEEAEKAFREALDGIMIIDSAHRDKAKLGEILGRLITLPEYRDDPARQAELLKLYK